MLPAIEATLRDPSLPRWRPRTGCLRRDLDAFGLDLPRPLALGTAPSPAAQFGLLYVIEGSRLGARLSLRRIDPGFSARYLSAAHAPGEWRAFTRALDARAAAEDAAWLEGALAGALHGFRIYAAAAEDVLATAR